MKSDDEKILMSCRCGGPEHAIIASLFVWEDSEPDLYIMMQTIPVWGVWKRFCLALGLLFKRSPKYGHWQETLMDVESAERFRALLEEFIWLSKVRALK